MICECGPFICQIAFNPLGPLSLVQACFCVYVHKINWAHQLFSQVFAFDLNVGSSSFVAYNLVYMLDLQSI